MEKLLRDTLLIYRYTLRSTVRNPVFVIIGLFNPLCFLFMFAPLLNELSHTAYFSGANTLAIFLPGLLIMMSLYATSFTGFKLIDEVRIGFIERLWVSPVSRFALVLGRALRDMTILLFQALSLIGLSFLSGLEASVGGIAITLVLVMLVGIVLSSCSYMLALILREEEGLAATINFFIVPLQLLAGITLPLTLAPVWLKTASRFNPLSHVVDASRSLFVGNFAHSSVVISFALMILLTAGTLYALTRVYKKRAV